MAQKRALRGLATFFLLMSIWKGSVDGACIGVQDAAGLTTATSSSDPNAVVNICGDIQVNSTIKIAQSVTLVGLCPYPGCRIFSNAQIGTGVGIFQVTDGAGTVTFRNLWLDGGFAQPTFNTKAGYCPGGITGFNGGAITTGSGTNLVVDSAVFTSNSACAFGGAINVGGNANISNSLFLNNTGMYGGGVAFTSGATLTIRNSNFSYNVARDRGSSLWLYEVRKATVQGSLFLYNRALGFGGGAVVAFANDATGKYDSSIIIAGNTFANNTCPIGGGAILGHHAGQMLIIGNLFLQNYAPSGGAVYLDHALTTIANPNTFLRNQADGSGPIVFVTGNASSTRLCPDDTAVPTTVGSDGGPGTPVASCSLTNCTVNNPCDPLATCTLSGGAPTCSCPARAPGNGWICDPVLPVSNFGVGSNFTILPALDLSYGGNVTSIAQVIGPSPNGTLVALPPSIVGAPPPRGAPAPSISPPLDDGGGSNTSLIVGVVVAVIVLVFLIVCLGGYCLYRRRKWRRSLGVEGPRTLKNESKKGAERPPTAVAEREAQAHKALGRTWRQFTYAELQDATGGFSREALLGEGAFGQVYLATLPDGTKLAVKQLKDGAKEMGEREFLGELDALGRVRHRNLVSLRGYCVTDRECFLVLDFAENGNLDAALRSRTRPPLDWDTRVNIAVGAARGLSYLHNDTVPPIIHRDIKSANILLDSRMQAQVADFGLAKLMADDQTNLHTMVRGTWGYLAPEMVSTGRVTPKSDVYSFGVVLLELATGFRALERMPDGRKQNLVEAVVRDRSRILTIVDPRLDKKFSSEAATRFTTIALACVARDESERPDMSDVLRGLENLRKGGASLGSSELELAPYQESTDGEPEDWFVGFRDGSASTSSASTNRSHSRWSDPHGYSSGNSSSYQMTMIQEGR